MATFVLNRNRDASDVIRGYVYQVEWTILRWLSLNPSEQLEIEGGEDIDLISECKRCDNAGVPLSPIPPVRQSSLTSA